MAVHRVMGAAVGRLRAGATTGRSGTAVSGQGGGAQCTVGAGRSRTAGAGSQCTTQLGRPLVVWQSGMTHAGQRSTVVWGRSGEAAEGRWLPVMGDDDWPCWKHAAIKSRPRRTCP